MSNTATLESSGTIHSPANGNLDYLNQYVSFWLGEQLLGVPVNSVQEVLNPQKIALTPKSRPEISGLLNLRGQIVTAVNLRKRMNLPDLEDGRESMNVVVRFEDESFSLLVDEVGDVINVSADTMEPVPHTLNSLWKSVTLGIFRLETRLFIILNVDSLLKWT